MSSAYKNLRWFILWFADLIIFQKIRQTCIPDWQMSMVIIYFKYKVSKPFRTAYWKAAVGYVLRLIFFFLHNLKHQDEFIILNSSPISKEAQKWLKQVVYVIFTFLDFPPFMSWEWKLLQLLSLKILLYWNQIKRMIVFIFPRINHFMRRTNFKQLSSKGMYYLNLFFSF